MASSPGGPTLSLDHLVALNEEIASLVRAGVPLGQGLTDLGRDLPGRLGSLAGEIGRRLDAGEELSRIFADGRDGIPPVYAAVVQAGLRSGKLAAALESIADALRRMADLKRMVRAALIYPFFVALLGYILLYFALVEWLPMMARAYITEGLTGGSLSGWLLETLVALGDNPLWRFPWLATVVGILVLVCWLRRRWSNTPAIAGRGLLGRLPSIGRVTVLGRIAVFAEVAALLIDHLTPLDDAITLAADASGDQRLSAAARELAQQIQSGQPTNQRANPPSVGFPPMLGWLLATADRQPHLAATLRQAAHAYRRQAQRGADALAIYFPIVLTIVIGGAATALLAMTVLVPWYNLIHQIGR